MKPRKRLPISRACLFAAAALLSVAPRARAANVFFDADGTGSAIGAATVGATGTWSGEYWYEAGTATSISGDGAVKTYTFTAADTAYFQGNRGTLTADSDQTITLKIGRAHV